MKVLTLKKRKDFVRAAKEFKVVTNGLVLQAALTLPAQQRECCFVGYTATKKIGKAHLRNLTKRRLRAACALVMPEYGIKNVNYVIIGRHNTATLDFDYLTRRLKNAILEINTQMFPKENRDAQKIDDSAD